MKKLTLLILLVVGLVFMGCETESITGDGDNYFNDEFETQQKSSNTPLVITGNIYVEVYVDYSDVVDNLPPDEFSPDGNILPLEVRMAEFISEYEIEMSNHYTIQSITQSTNCEYTYKWTVNEVEYDNYWGTTVTFLNTGTLGTKQKKKDEDDGTAFYPGPGQIFTLQIDEYADCF